MHHDRRMRALYALGVAAALVFGGSQAVAAPEVLRERACTRIFFGWCENGAASACKNYCEDNGYLNYACVNDPMRPRSCCTCSN